MTLTDPRKEELFMHMKDKLVSNKLKSTNNVYIAEYTFEKRKLLNST
jgi:hypothetical protein